MTLIFKFNKILSGALKRFFLMGTDSLILSPSERKKILRRGKKILMQKNEDGLNITDLKNRPQSHSN